MQGAAKAKYAALACIETCIRCQQSAYLNAANQLSNAAAVMHIPLLPVGTIALQQTRTPHCSQSGVGHALQCLNEEVVHPMVTCIKRLPRIMGAEGLAALWPGQSPSSTDLAGIIIGNDAINSCRFTSSLQLNTAQLQNSFTVPQVHMTGTYASN